MHACMCVCVCVCVCSSENNTDDLEGVFIGTSVGLLLLQGLSSRILQTETMIETLTHRDMSSRLVSFLLVLCRDFGIPGNQGITIDLRLSHQAIAEAIGSTRVTITRLLGDLRNSGLVEIDRKKITVLDPIALAKRFS